MKKTRVAVNLVPSKWEKQGKENPKWKKTKKFETISFDYAMNLKIIE